MRRVAVPGLGGTGAGTAASPFERSVGNYSHFVQNAAFRELCLGLEVVETDDGADERVLGAYSCDLPEATGVVGAAGGPVAWDRGFFEPHNVSARAGMFHFDHTQGRTVGLTWNRSWGTYDNPFNEANTSQLAVLVAGNNSVAFRTGICQKEGCPVAEVPCLTCSSRSFLWSCGGSGTTPGHSCWNVTNDYYSDVPTEMWSGEIPSAWTVTIDTRTAVLNKLTVRGNLIFQTNGGPDIELRAHYIDVRGGRLIMGNASHPILPGTIATLTLHGDRYKKVHDATLPACDKCRVENDKLLALNGNFSVHGTPVIAWARLARHAFAGDRVIELDAPNASAAGWRVGDELMITTSRPHLDQKYGGKENMGAHKYSNFGGSEYEYHTIARVNVSESGNRLVVTLAAPLAQDHIGENFTLTDAQRGPLPGNRSRVDMRAAVGHITRNAVVRAARRRRSTSGRG